MNNIFKKLSIKNLKTSINKYGFTYSTKDFILETLVIIIVVLGISYLSRLHLSYILVLVFITIIVIPLIIHAWFSQSYNMKRFSMLTDYLSNILPIFTQKTKIRFTLGELLDICNGQMRDSINEAIKYLDTTINDPNLAKNALAIIERDFPNSRVKSVHKLLLTIEAQNSLNFEDVCQNMYEDIEKWIKRVCSFQKDLKNRRNKLIILCVATLLMNCMFVFIYVSNETFIGFTDSLIYQISTLIFIGAILITITIVLTRLHGEWLINDTDYKNDEYLKEQYDLYKEGKKKIKIPDIILSVIFIGSSIYFFIIKQYALIIMPIILAIFLLTKSYRTYNNAYKKISKSLTIEFPIWLREISLNLSNLTVLNAIENSQNITSYPMRKEIRNFLNEAKKDPTSIKAYNNFLNNFDLEDAKSTMKVLYSIQNVGKKDVKQRVSNLIIRNQEMLDKAESLRNNDSISGIEALGYVPTGLFSIQMLVSMFSMFGYMMNTIAGSLSV